MGVPEFLSRVLEAAGRPVDLHDFHDGIVVRTGNHKRRRKRRRSLRIGVDVSTWVHRAIHGYSDMLGDERHLTHYGRADLTQQQQQQQAAATTALNPEIAQKYIDTCTSKVLDRLSTLQKVTSAEILVVLDGQTPPMKKKTTAKRRDQRKEYEKGRDQAVVDPQMSPTKANAQRTKAFRRAGAGAHFYKIIQQLQAGLQQAQMSFLVAPFEADSQLAYLATTGYLDLIVTEDSDLVAHGAPAILYKTSYDATGILLQYKDMGAVQGSLNLADFTPVMMAVLFVAAGSDYVDKLKGIGLMTAARIVRAAFLERKKKQPALEIVLEQLYQYCHEKQHLTEEFRTIYQENFLAAIVMYRHSVVYDPLERQCVLTGGSGDASMGDFELMDYPPYAALCTDMDRVRQIVGEIPLGTNATDIVEGQQQQPPLRTTPTSTTIAENDNHNVDKRTITNDNHNSNHQTQTTNRAADTTDAALAQMEDLTLQANKPGLSSSTKRTKNGFANNGVANETPNSSSSSKNKQHLKRNTPEATSVLEDSDATVLMMTSPEYTPDSRQSPNLLLSSSVEKTVGSSGKSPNLLLSSSVEKTVGSGKSPNLLCSSTPEQSQLSTQSQ